MDKLKLHTPDFIEANIAKLAELFPNCVTESRDAQGQVKRAIDFDLLKQELSSAIVDGPQERYQLNWPGKREALLTANAPIAKTLRPCREESVDFDATQNLFIEGDNLDALKLLQETYLNKVKMIYIDPPYNTGNDFIYEDDFAEDSESYKLRSNQKDEVGNRLVANNESNGRFHSDWLSMLYPRLKLARNLLADDGVLFISIDDCEAHNLRKIGDEIFGEINFYCSFVWKRRSGAMDSVDNVSVDHEHVLCYAKSKQRLNGIGRTYEKYKNPDNDPRGPWILDNLSAGKAGGDVYYPITDPQTGNQFYPPSGRYWPYNPKTMQVKIAEGRIIFPANPDGRPMLKRFKNEAKSETVPVSTWMLSANENKLSNALSSALNTQGTKELQEILGGKLFSHPKSTTLLKSLASQCLSGEDDIVLDFFAGSSTTAHAVMQLNAEDGGNRKFIMVQLAETCDEKSEAFKAGYNTITEIGKERIRRAGQKIKRDHADKPGIDQLDIGFRVLKVDSSNMDDIYYTPDALKQGDLFNFVDNVRDDRTEEDLLFQVLLDWGVDLSLPITRETFNTKDEGGRMKDEICGDEHSSFSLHTSSLQNPSSLTVFFIDDNALAACFDNTGSLTEDFVKQLASRQPLRVVFRDAGFASDSVKINVEQIFKLLAPFSEIKTL
jgi:adenine-specific DNA-methyltransferase